VAYVLAAPAEPAENARLVEDAGRRRAEGLSNLEIIRRPKRYAPAISTTSSSRDEA
jgi:hypothetical protein